MSSEGYTGGGLPYANMPKTKYSPYEEVNDLQKHIMVFIDHWVRTENTPVPKKEIVKAFSDKKKPDYHPPVSIDRAINALLYKGYVRKAYSGTNKTYYVQLRNI